MAVLKTDYKNDVFTGNRKYQSIDNGDGTVSLVDKTTYSQKGDLFGGKEINETNLEINNTNTELNKVQKYKLTTDSGEPNAGLTNYDLVILAGVYYQTASTNAPVSGSFILEVLHRGTTVLQKATNVSNGDFYTRVKTGSVWQPWNKTKTSVDDEWILAYDSVVGIAVTKTIPTSIDISLYQDLLVFQVSVNLGIPMYPRRDNFLQYYGISGYDAVNGFIHTEVTLTRTSATIATVDKSTYYTANYGTTNSGRTQPNIGSVYVRNKIY